jgi:hypothetical protein
MKDNVTKLPSPPNPRDPLDVNQRLYGQISKLLDQLDDRDSRETVTMRERIAALVAIGRIQVIFASLRKEQPNDYASGGSSVRRYQAAFKANAPGRRTKNTRSSATRSPDDDSLEAILAGGGDDAA